VRPAVAEDHLPDGVEQDVHAVVTVRGVRDRLLAERPRVHRIEGLGRGQAVASGALEGYAWLLPLSPDTPPSMTYYGSTLASPLRKVALSPISCGYQEYRGARPSVERAEQALGLVVRCALA